VSEAGTFLPVVLRSAGTTSPLRQGRRVRADGVVRLVVEGRRGIHTAFLRDLGRGGMFVHVVDPEPQGKRLEFSLMLSGKRRPLRGVAEVSWVRDEYEGPGHPPGMALRFVALEPAAVDALVRTLPAGEEPAVALLPPPPPPVAVPPPTQVEVELEEPPAAAATDEAPPDDELAEAPTVPMVERHARDASTSARWQGTAVGIAGVAGLLTLALVGAARFGGAPDARGVAPAIAAPAGVVHRAAAERPAESVASAPASASAALPASAPAPAAPAATSARPIATAPSAAPVAAPADDDVRAGNDAFASRLRDVRWESLPDGATRLVASFDGTLAAERVAISRIGGDTPRAVVVVHGIVDVPRTSWSPATPVLQKVRPGRHEAEGSSDLHLVLDLAPGQIAIERTVSGSELVLRIAPPPG